MTNETTKTQDATNRITRTLHRLGFRTGKTGWLDRDALRVAIYEDQVTIIQFTDTRTRVVAWEIAAGLQSTPVAVVEAAVKAAIKAAAGE
jgi:hypothetical protein